MVVRFHIPGIGNDAHSLPGYPQRCQGYTWEGTRRRCPTPTFPVQLCGRCVRCSRFHRCRDLAKVDPWISLNDVLVKGEGYRLGGRSQGAGERARRIAVLRRRRQHSRR